MENYVKLYQRILQSSVWKEPPEVRCMWVTMLALKDKDGVVSGSAEWLADQARVSDEWCQKALKIFLSPDKRSRTPDNDGRKIEKVAGGWRVLNHFLYRDGMEVQREKWARQKSAQRKKAKAEPTMAPTEVPEAPWGGPGAKHYTAEEEAAFSKDLTELEKTWPK